MEKGYSSWGQKQRTSGEEATAVTPVGRSGRKVPWLGRGKFLSEGKCTQVSRTDSSVTLNLTVVWPQTNLTNLPHSFNSPTQHTTHTHTRTHARTQTHATHTKKNTNGKRKYLKELVKSGRLCSQQRALASEKRIAVARPPL